MTNIDAALKLAEKGKSVFPCAPGAKIPVTKNGFKDATKSTTVIRKWWADHPTANVGLPTGAANGLVVLDVDVDESKGKNGEAALTTLVDQHGPFPETLTVRTPRGGRHFYFLHPGGKVPCSSDKLGNGLDIRGDGGYVIAVPSRTPIGEYAYLNRLAAAPLPLWLRDLIIEKPKSAHTPSPRQPHQTERKNEEQRVLDALSSIPADLPHDDWVRVLMALHAWDPYQGQVLARDWSATCAEKFRETDFEAAWRSFKPHGGVSVGTLFALAKNHGWTPPAPRQPRVSRASRDADETPELLLANWPDRPRPEAFHGVIGDYVCRLAPHTEADPMAILVQMLIGFGNLIGRTAYFTVEADAHYLNLNGVLVGNSSKARKGTSWGHVKKILWKVNPGWPKPLTGLSTGEGLIHSVRDPVTRENKNGEDEVVDAGVSDKRLLAVETEFGRMLQCGNRENNTLSAVVRQAFDTGDLRIATRSSPERATGAHISIIGHITIVELNQLLTKSDSANGFANRFLWCAVTRSKLLPEGGNASSLDFTDIIDKLGAAAEFANSVGRMQLSTNGRCLWAEIYRGLSVEQPGLLGAVCSRAEALIMRIATVLAVTDCSREIDVPHLKAALAIWDYCAESAKFVFGESLGNPIAEKVLGALQETGGDGLSLTALYDALNGHVTKEEMHQSLRLLHSQGLARHEKVKTSGRPSQVWFAKPESERSEGSVKKETCWSHEDQSSNDSHSSHNSLNSQEDEWKEEL